MTPRKLKPEEVTEPGWYWADWHSDYNFEQEIVRVRHERKHCRNLDNLVACVTATESQYPLCRFTAFYGPIPNPFEKEEDSK